MTNPNSYATSTEIEDVIKAFSKIRKASVRREFVRTLKAIASAEMTAVKSRPSGQKKRA